MSDFNQILKKTFLKNPNSPAFWLMLGLIFKGALFLGVILDHPYHDIPGIFGATMGDDSSYINPIDNLLHHGTYSPDFRMPGYGIVYLLFRLFWTQAGACNALVIIQIILASASVYYLALTAKNIFKKDGIFYLTFYLFLVCSFSNFYDAYIGSESLCTSILIFAIYLFTKYTQQQKSKYLFFTGALATWAMFIRPVFGGVVILCSLVIIYQKGAGFVTKIKYILLFLILFLICEGAWIYRNFETHKKWVPFNSTGTPFYPYAVNGYQQSLFEFVQSWGGVSSFIQKPSDLDWFDYYYPNMPPILRYDSLPDNIYTSAYNKDSLVMLKRMIIALRNPTIDTAMASVYQHKLKTKLKTYRLSFQKEKPFTYYIKAPLKMLGILLYGPETRIYLERGKSVPFLGKLIVGFNNFIYLILTLSGIIGLIKLIPYGLKQRSFLLIIPLVPLYTILVHSFIFRLQFNRYLMPAYPFLIICSAYITYTIYIRYFQHSLKA